MHNLCNGATTRETTIRLIDFGWNSGSRKLGDWKFFVSLEIVEWNGFDDDFFVTEMDRLR